LDNLANLYQVGVSVHAKLVPDIAEEIDREVDDPMDVLKIKVTKELREAIIGKGDLVEEGV